MDEVFAASRLSMMLAQSPCKACDVGAEPVEIGPTRMLGRWCARSRMRPAQPTISKPLRSSQSARLRHWPRPAKGISAGRSREGGRVGLVGLGNLEADEFLLAVCNRCRRCEMGPNRGRGRYSACALSHWLGQKPLAREHQGRLVNQRG